MIPYQIELDEIKKRPLDDNVNLWRYQTMDRFRQVIENDGLFFSHPTSFNDPDEGATTKDSFNELIVGAAEQFRKKTGLATLNADGIVFTISSLLISLCYASESLVNCWHYGEFESSLMWNSYSNESGVVLKTNAKLLKEEMAKHGGIVVPIEYFDFENPKKIIHPHHAYFYKRKEYESEREARAVVMDNTLFQNKIKEIFKTSKPTKLSEEEKKEPAGKDDVRVNFSHGDVYSIKLQRPMATPGKFVQFKINEIITEIVMHPKSTDNDLKRVEKILGNKKLNIPISKSKLNVKLKDRLF